ncbi:hypothetical protein CDO73_25555 [Saccharibacillus sp. O23]|nr:hypothetical protein CDO73_25555 [Saccharibacillus sp. O23]
MTEKRLESQTGQTQADRPRESGACQSDRRPASVLTWNNAKLNGNRIAQPWHERLRRIRGDQDLNF